MTSGGLRGNDGLRDRNDKRKTKTQGGIPRRTRDDMRGRGILDWGAKDGGKERQTRRLSFRGRIMAEESRSVRSGQDFGAGFLSPGARGPPACGIGMTGARRRLGAGFLSRVRGIGMTGEGLETTDAGLPGQPSLKSFQSRFIDSINAIFFIRPQALICFSRTIIASMLPPVS